MQLVKFVSAFDFVILPFYLLFFYLIARRKQKKMIETRPEYKYYTSGMMVRIFTGVFFSIFYYLYYEGGDMTDYFMGGFSLKNLMFYAPDKFLYAMTHGDEGLQILRFFDYSKGAPPFYMMDDPETFFVMRLITPFVFISFSSYIVTSVFTAWFAFLGIWKLFLVFYHYFPKYEKVLSFSILFFPSVLFWGSGIMKDPITLAGAGWYTYAVYMIFIKKEKIFKNILGLVFGIFLIMSTKPFVIIALMPGSLIWLMFYKMKSIENKIIRFLLTPVLILGFFWLGSTLMSSLSESLGEYGSLEGTLEKAAITQQDLLREEAYGSNSYNIGTFEPTLQGVAPKIPASIMAGLFRPYLWEANNFLMIISGLENTLLILMVLYCFFRVGIFRFFSIIFDEPLLIFSFVFSLFFSFSIGLATANFGALVRYKIPLLPFFVAMLFVTINKVREAHKLKKADKEAQKNSVN